MGYTTYFTKNRKPTKEEWGNFEKEVSRAFELFKEDELTKAIKIGDTDGSKLIKNSEELFYTNRSGECIMFNGFGDGAYETMALDSTGDTGFAFCKTNRKPYDVFVNIVLYLANKNMEGVFSITSNGSDEEDMFELAFEFCKKHSFTDAETTSEFAGFLDDLKF